ncbi:MAG: TIGR02587 family membrane protein [Gemmatimonadaceae bacterium]
MSSLRPPGAIGAAIGAAMSGASGGHDKALPADVPADVPAARPTPGRTRRFLIGLARALGGAVLFSLPMLMTMEMWSLGFAMSRLRLALLLVVLVPVLVGLSYRSGFEPTFNWIEDTVDAGVALFVGFVAAGAVLWLFGLLTAEMSLQELVGKVALQAVPASMGALLAQSQFGGQAEDEERSSPGSGYLSELLLMAAGALFLAFNVAPTEEMLLIAHKISPQRALVLALLSVAAMHAFVYAVSFQGQEQMPEDQGQVGVFLRLTVGGYAVALLVSAFVLWTFGRFDGVGLVTVVEITVVLGFPAAIGAAAARLIL